HQWSRKVYFGVSHYKKKRRQTAYAHQRITNWERHGRTRLRRRFVKVTDVRPYRHGSSMFLEFDVTMYGSGNQRLHGELLKWTFTEADLDRIHLEDLLALIKYLQGPILRPGFYAIALSHVTDYQMAIECWEP